MTRSRIVLICGIAVSALFLWLAVRDLDFTGLTATLLQTNLWLLIPFLFVLAGFCWLKSVRWARLLQPVCATRARDLIAPVVIGYMGTGLMPMQLGEIARAYLAARQLQARMAPVLASILVERILDIFALLVIVAAIGLAGAGLAPQYRAVGIGFLFIALFTLAVIWLYGTHTEAFVAFVRRCTTWLPARLHALLLDQLTAGASGVRALRDPYSFAMLAIMSLVQWGCMCACIWISLMAVGQHLPVLASLTVLAMTILAMTLPAGPGYVGSLQLAFVIALTPFQVASSVAVAASIFYLAALWVPLVGAGIVLLHRIGLRMQDLRNSQVAETP